nr:hypothetical protein [Hyphomonas sp. Mor2]
MADIDPAFMKWIFDIAQRERKLDIHHHRELEDIERRLATQKWIFARQNRLDRLNRAEQGGLR